MLPLGSHRTQPWQQDDCPIGGLDIFGVIFSEGLVHNSVTLAPAAVGDRLLGERSMPTAVLSD